MKFWGENLKSYQHDLQDCWYQRFTTNTTNLCLQINNLSWRFIKHFSLNDSITWCYSLLTYISRNPVSPVLCDTTSTDPHSHCSFTCTFSHIIKAIVMWLWTVVWLGILNFKNKIQNTKKAKKNKLGWDTSSYVKHLFYGKHQVAKTCCYYLKSFCLYLNIFILIKHTGHIGVMG